jgi:putative endonuclease
MFNVYALYNKKFRKIYIGYTSNLDARMLQHNEGFRGSYTSRFRSEWTLIYSEEYATVTEARAREKQLKSYRGREFIKKYIPE